jgi:hypothetical protein
MLHDLEAHVINQGLADMIAAADIITSVSYINPLLSYSTDLLNVLYTAIIEFIYLRHI